MSLSRRAFLASASATALSACAKPYTRQMAAVCRVPRDAELTIDAHCHLMNVKDGSGAAFATRRIFNFDEESSPGLERLATRLVTFVADLLGGAALPVNRERGMLRVELTADQIGGRDPARSTNQDFCFFAGHAQRGRFRADASRQITGFFSNRTRNAARMMTLYRDVDIFLPSMVDMYEGTRLLHYPSQIAFYAELNLATRGRFLPLASFTPEREYEDFLANERRRAKGEPVQFSQFDYLRHAIDNLGFVGVKLHPSTGFSPHDNLRWGCLNTPRQRVRENDRELYDQFAFYDDCLARLYAFCKSRDVPILTHNSTGITSNSWCMRGAAPEGHASRQTRPLREEADTDAGEWAYAFRQRRLQRFPGTRQRDKAWQRGEPEWTNAPNAWRAAMEAADAANPQLAPMKVILGHLANGFEITADKRLRASPWLDDAARAVASHPNLYADLSEISEFFKDGNVQKKREWFRRYLTANKPLARNLLYGSDWHMPGTATIGTTYIGAVRSLVPPDLRPRVMGQSAARLFGLRPGGQNRRRLAAFYADPPIPFDPGGGRYAALDTAEINWWQRV